MIAERSACRAKIGFVSQTCPQGGSMHPGWQGEARQLALFRTMWIRSKLGSFCTIGSRLRHRRHGRPSPAVARVGIGFVWRDWSQRRQPSRSRPKLALFRRGLLLAQFIITLFQHTACRPFRSEAIGFVWRACLQGRPWLRSRPSVPLVVASGKLALFRTIAPCDGWHRQGLRPWRWFSLLVGLLGLIRF